MEQVLKLAENYVMQRVMSNHAPLTHANKISLVLPILIGIMSAIGAILCLSGAYIWLSNTLPLYSALSIMGGIFFIIALLLMLGFTHFNRIKAKKTRHAREQLIHDVKIGIQSLDYELSKIDLIKENPKTCVSIATVLGYVISNKLS
jgi:hypothetical protein